MISDCCELLQIVPASVRRSDEIVSSKLSVAHQSIGMLVAMHNIRHRAPIQEDPNDGEQYSERTRLLDHWGRTSSHNVHDEANCDEFESKWLLDHVDATNGGCSMCR